MSFGLCNIAILRARARQGGMHCFQHHACTHSAPVTPAWLKWQQTLFFPPCKPTPTVLKILYGSEGSMSWNHHSCYAETSVDIELAFAHLEPVATHAHMRLSVGTNLDAPFQSALRTASGSTPYASRTLKRISLLLSKSRVTVQWLLQRNQDTACSAPTPQATEVTNSACACACGHLRKLSRYSTSFLDPMNSGTRWCTFSGITSSTRPRPVDPTPPAWPR